MAFKDFSAGDVLTAQDVDNFLMRQVVMVFDDQASRDTTLSEFLVQGMVTFLKDTNTLEFYSGSSFEPVVDPILLEGSSGQILISNGSAGSVWQDNGTPGQNIISAGSSGVVAENSISPLMLLGV